MFKVQSIGALLLDLNHHDKHQLSLWYGNCIQENTSQDGEGTEYLRIKCFIFHYFLSDDKYCVNPEQLSSEIYPKLRNKYNCQILMQLFKLSQQLPSSTGLEGFLPGKATCFQKSYYQSKNV